MSALRPYFLQESYRAFFSNHTFVFATRMQEYHRLASELNRTQGLASPSPQKYNSRDVVAARLLDFIDRPEWRGKGASSQIYNESYDHVDAYRHRIQHFIFLSSDTRASAPPPDMPDWDWPLKVDWITLPNLKTLLLDLRICSLAPQLGPEAEIEYDRMVEEGAKRMEVLSLKSLMVHGLCGDEDKKRRAREMFAVALAKEGELQLYGFEDTKEETEEIEAEGWNVVGNNLQEMETEW